MPLLDEAATLWDLGVRHDDQIELEFASPVMPRLLQVVRTGPQTRPKDGDRKLKGEPKGKKGGGKKKKKKAG